ncbi:cell wall hydrolase [Neobacillus sp. PS3-34]|uniref:cell wall hydrolase n=1 Tax=Neobacillus sp. PS3-34 TaxID=3070678 RepID=UPI0027DF56F0|nr:cell wall hydrolase [Neobacillus sp. PS3-34]WML47208.1 cell wall hydrolase [Neobacillus sp. PS3-34]
MKKIKKLVIASALLISMSPFFYGKNSEAATRTHNVRAGETYWKIASKYGVSVKELMKTNNKSRSLIYPGQKLKLPNSRISAAEKDLIARLVHAEAKGEPFAGKVAVATVILNRVASKGFPNTVKGVVYQKSNGHYAFTPVQNGAINQRADAASKRAVNEALAYRGQGKGSLFFYNPRTAKSGWIFSRKTTITIGHHKFAK